MGLNVSLYTAAILLMTGIIKQIVKLPLSMNRREAVFLSVLNVVGGMLTWMVIDISAVQIDREIFFPFLSRKKEMVWKIPMIAILLCAGEISAICIFQKLQGIAGGERKAFCGRCSS